MLKLMKYEFKKTWITKLILLGVTAVAEIAFLVGLYADKEGPLGLSIFVLMMLASVLTFAVTYRIHADAGCDGEKS